MGKDLGRIKKALVAVLCIVLVAGCTGEASGTTPVTPGTGGDETGSDVQAAVDSPAATPTSGLTIPASDGITFVLSGDNRIQVGRILPVMVEVIGDQAIGEVRLEAYLPMLALQVVDVVPETEVVEIVAEIPEEKVVQNEVVGAQTLLFSAQNLDLAESGGRLVLCTIMLRAVTPGEGDVSLYAAEVTSPDGESLAVSLPDDPFFIVVQEEPVMATPTSDVPASEPTPTVAATETAPPPTSTATPESVPTPESTPTLAATPTLVWTPTPGAPPTPAPLPPLSQVITEPIQVQPNSVYYRIHPTQTLYRLSKMFNTTVEAIMEANDIEDVRAVRAGRVLRIPVTPPVGNAAYLVSTRETLYSTAKAFGLTVEELAAFNGIAPAAYNDVEIGQWLVLRP